MCPCVVFSKTKQRLLHLQSRGTPLPGGGAICTADCWVYCCMHTMCGHFGILACVMQTGNRSNIRARYSIRGDTIDDCFKSFVCHCCALTQERREVELEENSF
ncbi:putative protein family Cys-rich [Lactarius tabidus]